MDQRPERLADAVVPHAARRRDDRCPRERTAGVHAREDVAAESAPADAATGRARRDGARPPRDGDRDVAAAPALLRPRLLRDGRRAAPPRAQRRRAPHHSRRSLRGPLRCGRTRGRRRAYDAALSVRQPHHRSHPHRGALWHALPDGDLRAEASPQARILGHADPPPRPAHRHRRPARGPRARRHGGRDVPSRGWRTAGTSDPARGRGRGGRPRDLRRSARRRLAEGDRFLILLAVIARARTHAGAIWLLAATMVANVLGYGYQVVMARLLRPEDYAILIALFGILILESISSQVIQSATAKLTAQYRARGGRRRRSRSARPRRGSSRGRHWCFSRTPRSRTSMLCSRARCSCRIRPARMPAR